MSAMYDEGYDLFRRQPELTVDELVKHAAVQTSAPRMRDEFCHGYNAARLDQIDWRKYS